MPVTLPPDKTNSLLYNPNDDDHADHFPKTENKMEKRKEGMH